MSDSGESIRNEVALPDSAMESCEVHQSLTKPGNNGTSPCLAAPEEMRISVANSRQSREKAYRLAYAAYRERKYAAFQENEWVVAAYDRRPETLTLLAEDGSGLAIGTVTIVYDGSENLPCDEIFYEELDELRGSGRRIVEVTRLAIRESYASSRVLLVLLFNWIYIHARLLRYHDDFVIEVNPRHVAFYRRLLGFEVLGRTRPCPRVQGAPAVLLRLDLSHAEKETLRLAGRGAAIRERSLYTHFLVASDEAMVLGYLRQNCREMTCADQSYFGLDDRMQPARAVAL